MRINKFIAQATGLSRRNADNAIADKRVLVNGELSGPGTQISETDTVTLDAQPLALPTQITTIMINKPAGYVVSRDGQGSRTIYELLPDEFHTLKSIGRLDKDTSGLLLLTSDGQLANELTHPSYQKVKIYSATLNKPLTPLHHQMISDIGINLEDGKSRLQLDRIGDDTRDWKITMHEGRNRQIRRTFASLGYEVLRLNRHSFGPYVLPDELEPGDFKQL